MDDKKLDQLLREHAERVEEELPYSVEKRIDQTLEDLPDSVPDKQRGFWSAWMRYVLTGIASVIFVVIALSYYQISNTPVDKTANPDESSQKFDKTFSHEEPPFEHEELTEQMEDLLAKQYPIDVTNLEITFAFPVQNRWLVMTNFTEEALLTEVTALFEVKRSQQDTDVNFLTVNNKVDAHWYNEDHYVGFGSINSLNRFIEKVRIKTENHKFISNIHNKNYMYVSAEKPEKVEFLTSEGTVIRTLETFNFDEQYPLIAQVEGQYGLLVVGNDQVVISEFLDKHGIRNVSNYSVMNSLKSANDRFTFLNSEKAPVYVVFDDKEMVYKTHNRNDLIKFLKEN
ncbi:hypothetical protein GCM10008986_27260 [Salinibacillus aidingensis]|uniref:DUF4367 domain-containing protein n=1 Tax=Salinibacillus aidingensis TaxID=237684 RepID=A0ABN1BJ64_9BACI